MSVIGALEVQMFADMARLRQDMGQGVKIAENAARNIQDVLGRVGAGLSIGAVVMWTKSVIDAGGAAIDMAQKVGMSVEDMTALQAVFQQSGVGADAFKTGIVQMSKSIEDNAEAYAQLKVATKEADGSTRESKAVLLEVSNIFAKLPDGLLKTKLATELFGKAGADMIPALNAGSAAIERQAQLAKEYGIAMTTEAATAADDLGDSLDVLKLKAQSSTMQGIAPMLPVLTELAKQLALTGVEANKAGSQASFWQEAFSTAAEAVSVLVLNVGYVFRATTGEVSTWMAQLKGLATGGLEEFNRIGSEWRVRAAAMREEVDRQSDAILRAREKQQQANDALKAGAAAADLSAGEARRLGLATGGAAEAMARAAINAKELAAAKKKAAEEAKHLAEQQQKLRDHGTEMIQKIVDEAAALQMQARMGRQLTDGEKEYLKVAQAVRDKKALLTDEQLRQAWAAAKTLDATQELIKAEEERAKTQVAVTVHTGKMADEQIKHTAALREGVLQLREENSRMQLGDAAFTRRAAHLLRGEAAMKEWQAAMEGGNYQLTEQARLLRERADLMEEGVAIREAKAATEEWKKTADAVNGAITDALMRGFESGRSFWTNFRNTLINSAKTMVLRPMIEFTMSPISQQWGSWLKLFGSALGGLSGGTTNGAVDPDAIKNLGKSGASSGGTKPATIPASAPAGAQKGQQGQQVVVYQNLTVHVDAAADQARLRAIATDIAVRTNRETVKSLKATGAIA